MLRMTEAELKSWFAGKGLCVEIEIGSASNPVVYRVIHKDTKIRIPLSPTATDLNGTLNDIHANSKLRSGKLYLLGEGSPTGQDFCVDIKETELNSKIFHSEDGAEVEVTVEAAETGYVVAGYQKLAFDNGGALNAPTIKSTAKLRWEQNSFQLKRVPRS